MQLLAHYGLGFKVVAAMKDDYAQLRAQHEANSIEIHQPKCMSRV